MARILHIGDMHLDSPFSSRLTANQAKLRRSEQRKVFSEIIKFASENADIMLISGDLFDSENISAETEMFLIRSFSEISSIPVFIAAGNHDFLSLDSVYSKLDLGQNVHVFSTDGEYFDLEDLSVRVCGQSFSDINGTNMKSPTDFGKSNVLANILVILGNVDNGNGEYNPISKSDIESSEFDYIALGHIHSFSGIKLSGGTRWAYPGIPEPRGFDELENSGAIFGEVTKSLVSLELIPFSERRYYNLNIKVDENIADNEALIEKITNDLEKFNDTDIFRINIYGTCRADFRLDIELLENRLESFGFLIEIVNNTEDAYDLNIDENDRSLRADFIRAMTTKIENSDSEKNTEVLKKAMAYGLDALDGKL